MSDVTTAETKYGHAHFKRVLDDGNYGKNEASIMLPFVVDSDESVTDLNMKVAFIQAKTAVMKELQIETTVLDDGTVIELLQASFAAKPQAQASSGPAAPQSQQSRPAPQGGGGNIKVKVFKRMVDPRGGTDDRGNPLKIENPPWLLDQIAAAQTDGKTFEVVGGFIELWDNRERLPQFGGNGKQTPWFKDKNGTGEAVWCPRDHEMSNPTWRHPAFAAGAVGPTYNDEEPF